MILSSAAPSLFLSHTLHHFTLFYFVILNKDSLTEHSSDRGGLHIAGGCHKVKCANEKERERERERERKKCHFLDNDKAAVFNVRNAMQCRQIILRVTTAWKLDDLRPGRGVQSDRVQFDRVVRAQRVHPWRLPWRPHAYRAALRVSPASKFSERYLSFPPNFTTFGHFLQPTTTWIVLTKPSSALLCKNILAPSKVGLNRKRSDFSDLPNGLQAWVRCPSGLASLHHSRLSTRSSYQLYSSWSHRRFCYDNHGSFVYDSSNLFCGPSGSVRTGLTAVRSEPGHRTHLTSLLSETPRWWRERV